MHKKPMPCDDYKKMCALDNLRRAYRWIQSNPDAGYKSYFREDYAAYAASSDYNLRRLKKNLERCAYEPGHAAKIYQPKPSGILRPITLLTVNDQIVYQACINIIAERLNPKISKRKNKQIFGHLYAGKSSKFFYLKWQSGYKLFSKNVIQNVESGYNFVANFDLAAFYDSIDHHVIRHFLKELKVDVDLIDFLLGCLKTWTCNTWTSVSNYIYHEHGIPQGPLSSGMLSELILKHIDDVGARKGNAKYLRYVDDIKIFSKDEGSLRQRLISLDIAAKEVGLFPQSSKVNIRKVNNPLEEIKSISRPPEPAVFPSVKQETLRKRLLEMSRVGIVVPENVTRFKYLLSHAEPSSTINTRMVTVLKKHPFLSRQISNYLSKYKTIPKRTSRELFEFLHCEEIYHAANADVLFAVVDNLHSDYRETCARFCQKRIFSPGKGLPRPQPSYMAALIAWVIKNNRVTFAQLEKFLENQVDWHVLNKTLSQIDIDRYGRASFELLMNKYINHSNADIARNAALTIINNDLNVSDSKKAHEAARLLLYVGGKIRRIGKPESLVGTVLIYVLSSSLKKYDWQKLLGAKNTQAEHIAFTAKRNFESDINAFIVTLDSLADFIFEVLFCRYVPGKTFGKYGAMLQNPAMRAALPKVCDGFDELHLLRLQSLTAHPRHSKSGGHTRRLKHYDFYRVRPKLIDAIKEIISTVSP